MPSPKDTKGPIVDTGPTKGKNRSRNNDGSWRKKRSDTGKKREKNSDSGCFISTAATQHKGLPDNCRVLNILRGFRDDYLMASPEGQLLVKEYYQDAPALAARLKDDSDFNYVWNSITNCINLIENKQYSEAVTVYSKMFLNLKSKFNQNSSTDV